MKNTENTKNIHFFSRILRNISCFLGAHDYYRVDPTEKEASNIKTTEENFDARFHELASSFDVNSHKAGEHIQFSRGALSIFIDTDSIVRVPVIRLQVRACRCCHKREIVELPLTFKEIIKKQ